jgi:hypothetical protein
MSSNSTNIYNPLTTLETLCEAAGKTLHVKLNTVEINSPTYMND